MSVDPKLLEILRCPVTKQTVRLLSKDKLTVLNAAIAGGDVSYIDGSKIEAPLDEALITDNGRTVYRVDDGIPVMLEDMGIGTEQLTDF
ncbi:MAG: Trm112 family protein [Gammaproteobacteria bacterium]|nr:Trm112 family protein [Gammaproteobacteria bacterium]MDH3466421.1 Trm112 family protein [Gammaproteobacteria bacterium]